MTLSRHLLFHMVRSLRQPVSLLVGVGRATLEKGLELMETWGISFFREGRWLFCTIPNTSRRHSWGNILPRSLQHKNTPFSFWLLNSVSQKWTAAGELTWEQRGECGSSDSGTDAAGTSVVWGQGSCRPSAECCHCNRVIWIYTVRQSWRHFKYAVLFLLLVISHSKQKMFAECIEE